MSTLLVSSDSTYQSPTMRRQIVLWIGANAGGVGKTTLAVHIGYEMAERGFDVALLDLDSNGSMSLFCGLPKTAKLQNTMASVFSESFAGDWPLVSPNWDESKGKLQICPGGGVMSKVTDSLTSRRRREYILADQMQRYPLPHHLVILDCPATLGTRDLQLNPAPEILGFVPSQYDGSEAAQRKILSQLPSKLAKIKIPCYPQIRYSSEFNNASGKGMPLHLYRGNHEACHDFSNICDDLTALIQTEA